MFIVKVFGLIVIATICRVNADFRVVTFLNGDFRNENSYSNVEVHCFEINENNETVYVRGTYGQRGYFEGPVSSGTAYVNYQEISYMNENGLTPSAGAGILNYDENFNYTSGTFWASGAGSDVQSGGVSDWGITTRCVNDCYEGYFYGTRATDQQIANQYCFWDTNSTIYNRENIHYKPWWVLGYENPNTWYKLNVGFQESLGGAIAGAYRYTYPSDVCDMYYNGCKKGNVEWGIYSQETIISGFNNSIVLATEWKATSGPLSGESGSALYAIVAGPGQRAKQIGFFCNSKLNTDPSIPAKKVLTRCTYDSLNNDEEPNTPANRKLSQTLLKTYAKKEYAYWWHNLSVFINTIWGNHFSSYMEGAAAVLAPSSHLRVASWWNKIWG